MASAATLIRSGRCVEVKGNRMILHAALPMEGKVILDLPLEPAKVEELAKELRKAQEYDAGRRYPLIFSIWLGLLRRALGR